MLLFDDRAGPAPDQLRQHTILRAPVGRAARGIRGGGRWPTALGVRVRPGVVPTIWGNLSPKRAPGGVATAW